MGFHSIQLNWDAVTTDLGGGPLTGLTGYRVYGGTNPVSLSLMYDTASAAILTKTFNTLPSYGPWYFDVTAYDNAVPPNEGPVSNVVVKNIIDDGPGGGFF